jgi:hypothetical protein
VSANKICPQCGKNNLEGKRFCVECGARLDKSVAPAGGKETPPTDQVGQEACQQLTITMSSPFPARGSQTCEHSSQKIDVLSRRTNDAPNN